MSDTIFSLDADENLVELTQAAYESEKVLQNLLGDHPALLLGERTAGGSSRLLLVGREVSLRGEHDTAGTWKIDHLFLDDQAVPCIVEVKHSKNSQLRREVVGQMLDYAANAAMYWPVQTIISTFQRTCELGLSVDPDEVLAKFLGSESEPEAFWDKLKTNLQAGRLRLIFVADAIPSELRRIIEFLNVQMDPVEVLGIELRKFANGTAQVYVPRVIGATAEAGGRKGRLGASGVLYDAVWYRAEGFDEVTLQAFEQRVDEMQKVCDERRWDADLKYNKRYAAMKIGYRNLFGVSWESSKKLGIFFKVPREVAAALGGGLPSKRYDDQWAQAVYDLPLDWTLERFLPLMEASYGNLPDIRKSSWTSA